MVLGRAETRMLEMQRMLRSVSSWMEEDIVCAVVVDLVPLDGQIGRRSCFTV